MIFQKKCLQTQRPFTNSNESTTLNSFVFTPRKTNYIFKKAQHPGQIQVNCLPNFKSIQQVDGSPTYNRNKNAKKSPPVLKIQPSSQISCTSFMKSYIDKLKKQRKRQHKKVLSSRTQKEDSQRQNSGHKLNIGKNQIYMTKQMNQIFILQRVCKRNGNGLNTITVVEQNLNDLQLKTKKYQEERSDMKWDEPTWANKQKIDKLIKQIRDSRKKVDNIEDTHLISEEQPRRTAKTSNVHNLPYLNQRSRQLRSRAKSKQVTRKNDINFKVLEPWKQDQNIPEFSIEQYDSKDIQQN